MNGYRIYDNVENDFVGGVLTRRGVLEWLADELMRVTRKMDRAVARLDDKGVAEIMHMFNYSLYVVEGEE